MEQQTASECKKTISGQGNITAPAGMDYLNELKQAQAKQSGDCPHCGRCPSCGRGGYAHPYYPSYPYSYPYYPQTIPSPPQIWYTSIQSVNRC